jgi:hypothetical protein
MKGVKVDCHTTGELGTVMSDAFYGDDSKFYVVVLSAGQFIKCEIHDLTPIPDEVEKYR